MSIRINLYSGLQGFADGRRIVEVEGDTVGQCLSDLLKRFPKLRPVLFDEEGKLSIGVFISVNLNSPDSESLARRVTEKDELYIIRIIGGG